MSDYNDNKNKNKEYRADDTNSSGTICDESRNDAIHAYEQLFNDGNSIDPSIIEAITQEDIENQEQDASGELLAMENEPPVERVADKRSTYLRKLADPAEKVKLNQFDLVFIKLWSIIVSVVVGMANGINFALHGIFKRKAPDKYVRAFVATMLIILMIVLVTLPFKVQVNQDAVYDIYGESLVPVLQNVGSDDQGYTVYKWGYANKKNQIKIECRYEEALPFMHNAAWVRVVEQENRDGKVFKRDYWKLIDKRGKNKGKTPQEFNYSLELGIGVRPCGDFTSDVKLAWVYNGSYGYIDTGGNIKVDFKYKYAENFSEGYARVKEGNSEFFINKSGKKICAYYEEVKTFSYGRGAVKKNGVWGFIDSKGKEIVAPTYDDVSPYLGEYAAVRNANDKFGIIDLKGKVIVDYNKYNDILPLSPEFKALIDSIRVK